MDPMELDHIFIKGAREHNLKNINVKIPKKKLSVLTGVSGSGGGNAALPSSSTAPTRRTLPNWSPSDKGLEHEVWNSTVCRRVLPSSLKTCTNVLAPSRLLPAVVASMSNVPLSSTVPSK